MRLRAWPLIHPSPAIRMLMINWFVLGKDNLKREANDTEVPFVRPEAKCVAREVQPLSLADRA
ncbi:MAG: hypothetical protein DYH03_11910 [Nitrospira sp. NTP1]|nr:hypothetical protein [Nitrospira sp. NTP1]